MENKNVVILMYQYSVVVKGIENKLAELGYSVKIVSENFDVISDYAPSTALFMVYLPMGVADDQHKTAMLSRIMQMVSTGGSKLMILGEAKYYDDLAQKLPDIQAFEWVNRPINMEKFPSLVEAVIKGEHKAVANGQKRVLIVDDDPSYAKMVREWIRDQYRVDIVTAGMQAITFLLKLKEDEQVDLILLDYEMPVVDGPQVLQMLRQEPTTARIPVIFLTGLGTKEAVGRVMELKPDGYLLKTTSREDLLGYLGKRLH